MLWVYIPPYQVTPPGCHVGRSVTDNSLLFFVKISKLPTYFCCNENLSRNQGKLRNTKNRIWHISSVSHELWFTCKRNATPQSQQQHLMSLCYDDVTCHQTSRRPGSWKPTGQAVCHFYAPALT